MQGRVKGLIVDTQSSSEGNTAGEKWVEAREVKGLCEEVKRFPKAHWSEMAEPELEVFAVFTISSPTSVVAAIITTN